MAEVFLTAFEQRGRFDPARAVVPWLFGIATNLLHRFHRQEQRVTSVLRREPQRDVRVAPDHRPRLRQTAYPGDPAVQPDGSAELTNNDLVVGTGYTDDSPPPVPARR